MNRTPHNYRMRRAVLAATLALSAAAVGSASANAANALKDWPHITSAVKQDKAMEARIRLEAKTIAESYLAPPHTTDFAILFLPVEGLYAEVLRRPGLMDALQRDFRVTLAGPTTLLAILNSLHMGFRTLALEKQASEVWKVLGAVKTEFGKFGEVLAATKTALERAAKNIDHAEVRTRQMTKKLKQVEALPGEAAQSLLGIDVAGADADL